MRNSNNQQTFDDVFFELENEQRTADLRTQLEVQLAPKIEAEKDVAEVTDIETKEAKELKWGDDAYNWFKGFIKNTIETCTCCQSMCKTSLFVLECT